MKEDLWPCQLWSNAWWFGILSPLDLYRRHSKLKLKSRLGRYAQQYEWVVRFFYFLWMYVSTWNLVVVAYVRGEPPFSKCQGVTCSYRCENAWMYSYFRVYWHYLCLRSVFCDEIYNYYYFPLAFGSNRGPRITGSSKRQSGQWPGGRGHKPSQCSSQWWSESEAPDCFYARATLPPRAGVLQGELRVSAKEVRAGSNTQPSRDYH